MRRSVVGIDVGGTFTDVVAVYDGGYIVFKVPTDSDNPFELALTRLAEIIDEMDGEGTALEDVVHGTTVVTNAVIEGKLGRTALITTEGFRDVVEIARQHRRALYEVVHPVTRPPLVSRSDRYEIAERTTSSGAVTKEPGDDELQSLASGLLDAGYDAIAVSLINSVHCDRNERRIARTLIEHNVADGNVVCGALVDGQSGEYERSITAIVNAGLLPLVDKYLDACVEELRNHPSSRDANLFLMTSNGGFAHPDLLEMRPATALMSGPAAGVGASRLFADMARDPVAVTFDMGGTSTDVSLLDDYQIELTDEVLGFDYPIRHPSVAIETIGAGGGSIAHRDGLTGALKVGPLSAGANPGPACYGLGGTEPTVCDAVVALGYLPDGSELGEAITVDKGLALEALHRLGAPYGWNAVETAWAVFEIANVRMAEAIRLISVKRGTDIRGGALYAFGGSGPIHAHALGAELGFRRIVVPPFSSMFSALGCLTGDMRLDGVDSIALATKNFDADFIGQKVGELRARLLPTQTAGKAPQRPWQGHVAVDVKYEGQNHSITIPLVDPATYTPDELHTHFEKRHMEVCGYVTDDPSVITAVRLTLQRPSAVDQDAIGASLGDEPSKVTPEILTTTNAYFGPSHCIETPIFARTSLPRNHRVPGPAIITDEWSTVLVGPDQSCYSDVRSGLVIDV